MNCQNCGNPLGAQDQVCANCGTPVAGQGQQPQQPQQQWQGQQPPQQQWQGQPQQPPQQQWQGQGQQPPQQQWQGQPQQPWQQGQPQQAWQQGGNQPPPWQQQGGGRPIGANLPPMLANKTLHFWLNIGAVVLMVIMMLIPWMKIGLMGIGESAHIFNMIGDLGDYGDLNGFLVVLDILYLVLAFGGIALMVLYVVKLFTNYRQNIVQTFKFGLFGMAASGGAAVIMQIFIWVLNGTLKKELGGYASMVGSVVKGMPGLYITLILALGGVFYLLPTLKKEAMSGR